MMTRLEMNQSQWETMRAHVQACAPMEGCGLLTGTGETVRDVFPIPNVEKSPKRFRMDPAEQLRAFNSMEERGLELLGIFHSHPADPGPGIAPAERPSASDIQEAAYPVVYVIWSRDRAAWRAHGYWIENDMVSEVPLQVSAGQ
jgi:proteasome lid subunit RPN8/RPN11